MEYLLNSASLNPIYGLMTNYSCMAISSQDLKVKQNNTNINK